MSTNSNTSLGKSFEPQTFEQNRYKFWQENGCFDSKDTNAPGQESFCIVIPPPNVTGALHMGHALTNTIQDTLVRWHRMKGDNTLWLPGTDHAGIATQTQVEKQIAKEGKGPTGKPLTRHDLGREKFLERTWEWKKQYGSEITNQLRRLGSSLDWKRERFTMDEGFSRAVREVFVRLYSENLIYRGERIINWCPRCQTALSDLEVEPKDRKSHLWHLSYPVEGSSERLTIATTRPETLLGDSAVAVHPADERYKHLHGKRVKLPLMGRSIPIITDEYVDKEFGSGALKVTPAHDFNDYDLGIKHKLEMIEVMGKDGKITANGGVYAGMKFSDARTKVVEDLTEQGFLVKIEDHSHKVGLCQRCETVAEPVISKQWFVKIAPLAKPAIEAVETGKIQFTPKSWEKTYFEWMYNIRDWCISRQLWWGHQIPAWYCAKCEEITVAQSAPDKCSKCSAGKESLKQDEDVLDTWFSSGLWPFGTLGWPDQTPALKTFYPTAILETGFDIIFFWVARMIMMGIHFMGEVPFHNVYLHAMVRDEKGEKMSKSKGNVIDPLVLIDQHGADPLRFTLCAMAGQGRDIKLSVDRVEGYRAFCNKLWNAVKYFYYQQEPEQGGVISEPEGDLDAFIMRNHTKFHPVNRWILSRAQEMTAQVESGFAKFELDESAKAVYEFTWHEFCDWYIEFTKVLVKESAERRIETLGTIHFVLNQLLHSAHPMMPFVTEELWHSLPFKKIENKNKVNTLMLEPFSKSIDVLKDEAATNETNALKGIIDAIRNFRGENNLSPKVEFEVRYLAKDASSKQILSKHENLIRTISRISGLKEVLANAPSQGIEAIIPVSKPAVDLKITLDGLVNVEEETKRLQKEIEKVKSDVEHVRRKLSQETFLAKAPPALIAKERETEQLSLSKLAELEKAMERLSKIKK